MMGFTTDESLATELELYIRHDRRLRAGQTSSIITNLAKKMAKGTYDRTQAVKLWRYLADSGAKKYNKEFNFGGIGDVESAMRARKDRIRYEEKLAAEAARQH